MTYFFPSGELWKEIIVTPFQKSNVMVQLNIIVPMEIGFETHGTIHQIYQVI